MYLPDSHPAFYEHDAVDASGRMAVGFGGLDAQEVPVRSNRGRLWPSTVTVSAVFMGGFRYPPMMAVNLIHLVTLLRHGLMRDERYHQ